MPDSATPTTAPDAGSPRRASGRPRTTALLLLTVLLLATAVAAVTSARLIDDRRDVAREQSAATAVEAIDRRIAAYTEILYGARSHAAGRRPSLRDFHRYIEGLDVGRRYPGFQVIVFAEAVPHERLDAFGRELDAAARRSGLPYPDYQLTPPGRRDRYVVVRAMEPQRGNDRAFGFDLLAEPTRRAAVERARDTGTASATGPITLVQETGSQRGFLIMLPAYRPGATLGTVAERRRAFLGVQAAAFRTGDLMAGVLGDRADSAHLEIYDQGVDTASRPPAPDATRLLYASRSADHRSHALTELEILEVGGRRWAVHYDDAAGAISGLERAVPWFIAAAGTAISLLATWLLLSLSGSRARALRLAGEMTTELRDREVVLEQRARELERSNRDLAQFASVASHDLKTPLRSVKGYVDLLARRYRGRLDADADEFLAFASDGTIRMQALIDDLLAYAAVGSEPRPAGVVDLDEVVRRSVEGLRPRIAETGADVRVAELPTVPGDEGQLGQLVDNLLANALKFTDPARPPIVSVVAEELPEGWRIEVTDNGIGLAGDDAERIFAMFGRLHSADAYPGTGIGLAICQRIAENHGGSIGARPNEGPGATFFVTLPATAAAVPSDGRLDRHHV